MLRIVFLLFALCLPRLGFGATEIPYCRLALNGLPTFDSDFADHIEFVNWTYGDLGLPIIVSGGHTMAAIENFAVLRPDLFPQGPAPFAQFNRDGTIIYTLPKEAFTTNSWRRSAGRSKIPDRKGIKSAFPVFWRMQDIREAALHIYHSPQEILRRDEVNGVYLDGEWRGVRVRIHVIGHRIMRAYPMLPNS